MIANMNKIIDGLFLGSVDAANDSFNLKRNGISHILTAACGLTPANVYVNC
jgi:hypothetical protein